VTLILPRKVEGVPEVRVGLFRDKPTAEDGSGATSGWTGTVVGLRCAQHQPTRALQRRWYMPRQFL